MSDLKFKDENNIDFLTGEELIAHKDGVVLVEVGNEHFIFHALCEENGTYMYKQCGCGQKTPKEILDLYDILNLGNKKSDL